MDCALIIHENPEMRMVTRSLVAKGLQLETHEAANLQEARGILRSVLSSCKLIVASLSAPLDDLVSNPIDRVSPHAIEFLREVREQVGGTTPACLFLVTAADPKHSEQVAGLANAKLLGLESFDSLCRVASELLNDDPPPAPGASPPLDICITLTFDTAFWYIRGENGLPSFGPIKIEPRRLESLLVFSSAVRDLYEAGKEKSRAGLIKHLSQDLFDYVAGSDANQDFRKQLSKVSEDLSLLERVRLHFELNARTCPLLVETFSFPRGNDIGVEDDLWMLRLPIYRQLGRYGGRLPLFKDKASQHGPVKCLLIQGESREFTSTGSIVKRFPALPDTDREVAWLENHLKINCQQFHLEAPKVLRASDYSPDEFASEVIQCLQSQPWQLIHYSGHSERDPHSERAYLILGSGKNSTLDVEDFARYAAHAQFVFLNSCSSANWEFVLRLVERKIPAVAGYGWPMPDKVAANFSKKFYENLFPAQQPTRHSFLEYSFMRAKAGLYKDFKNEAYWLAPLLFMQTPDTEAGLRFAHTAGTIQ